MSDKPKLIIRSASSSSNVWTLKENLDYALTIEMDGMVMSGASSWNLMKPGVVIGLEDTRNQMAGFEEFNAQRHNYFLTQTDDPGDVFNDAAWAQVVENFRTVAFAAKEAGYKGLIFDNEEYNGKWQNYPEHYENADPSNKLAYQDQAALRGKQIMEAINEVFPDAEFGVMHGPYMSVFQEGQPDAITGQGGGADRHELRGPFFTGLAEGLGPEQTLIDMGELYKLRSEDDFAESLQYRSETIPDLFDWNVPQEVRDNWDEMVVQSHMLITTEFPVGSTMTPEILEETLLNAFKQSEERVFIFSNPGEEDWFTPDGLDPDWLRAVENATARAESFFEVDQPTPVPGDYTIDGTLADYSALANSVVVSLKQDIAWADGVGDDDLSAVTSAIGSAFDDQLIGDAADNVLAGGAGSDELYGNGGDDIVIGGAGADIVAGGPGIDLASYETSAGAITLNLREGVGYGADAEGDVLIGLEGAIGSLFDDLIIGGDGNETLFGSAGDDEMYGNYGNDELNGGAGNDVIAGGPGNDTVTFEGHAEAVVASLADQTSSDGDTLIGLENITGSDFDDALSGQWEANVLRGGDGDDLLTGLGGRDQFVFDADDGRDTITDFLPGQDLIVFSETDAAFGALLISEGEAGAIVSLENTSVILVNVAAASLTENDFVF